MPRRNAQLDVYRQRFLEKLGPGTQVKKLWAEKVLLPEYADRFRLKDDGTLEVLEIGETTPYDVSKGQDPVDLLVQDVLRTVPSEFRVLGRPDTGGGTNGAGSGEIKPRSMREIQQIQRQQVGYASP